MTFEINELEANCMEILGKYYLTNLFSEKLDEGFNEVCFGSGPWINGKRVYGMWAFFDSNRRISTYIIPQMKDCENSEIQQPIEATYAPVVFSDLAEITAGSEITFENRKLLSDYLQRIPILNPEKTKIRNL